MTPTTLLDGRRLAESLRARLHPLATNFHAKVGHPPCLVAYLVGDDHASQIYIRNKQNAAGKIGIKTEVFRWQATTPPEDVERHIIATAKLADVHGILLQLPLPTGHPVQKLQSAIPPAKDVDGLHTYNCGLIMKGDHSGMTPCTPQGCLALIKLALGRDISGLHAVVLGRSQIVGLPIAQLLLSSNCTVSHLHSQTPPALRRSLTKNADIIVTAVGRPNTITGDDIKPGTCLIDVGINRHATATGTQIVGDIDQESVTSKAGFLSPVPGGVGPMTIAYLLFNTLKAAYLQHSLDTTGFE